MNACACKLSLLALIAVAGLKDNESEKKLKDVHNCLGDGKFEIIEAEVEKIEKDSPGLYYLKDKLDGYTLQQVEEDNEDTATYKLHEAPAEDSNMGAFWGTLKVKGDPKEYEFIKNKKLKDSKTCIPPIEEKENDTPDKSNQIADRSTFVTVGEVRTVLVGCLPTYTVVATTEYGVDFNTVLETAQLAVEERNAKMALIALDFFNDNNHKANLRKVNNGLALYYSLQFLCAIDPIIPPLIPQSGFWTDLESRFRKSVKEIYHAVETHDSASCLQKIKLLTEKDGNDESKVKLFKNEFTRVTFALCFALSSRTLKMSQGHDEKGHPEGSGYSPSDENGQKAVAQNEGAGGTRVNVNIDLVIGISNTGNQADAEEEPTSDEAQEVKGVFKGSGCFRLSLLVTTLVF